MLLTDLWPRFNLLYCFAVCRFDVYS